MEAAKRGTLELGFSDQPTENTQKQSTSFGRPPESFFGVKIKKYCKCAPGGTNGNPCKEWETGFQNWEPKKVSSISKPESWVRVVKKRNGQRKKNPGKWAKRPSDKNTGNTFNKTKYQSKEKRPPQSKNAGESLWGPAPPRAPGVWISGKRCFSRPRGGGWWIFSD